MDINKPNAHGVLPEGRREVVASRGRAYAAIRFALSEDGFYRFGVDLHYGHQGYFSPISIDADGFADLDAARLAGLMELLANLHEPYASDGRAAHDEYAELRRQIEAQLAQPSLF